MPRILLINPNTNHATTKMMVGVAQAEMPAGFEVHGITAQRGALMISTPEELDASAVEALACWADAGTGWAGVILSCFGDPGHQRLQTAARVPVVGLCEAAMLDASRAGRRFGVATTTPELAGAIAARADDLGLSSSFTGLRATEGDPALLTTTADALERALAAAIALCVERDGAQAVIVGGGPLGHLAAPLALQFSLPVIAPIVSAARLVCARIEAARTGSHRV